MRPALLVAVSLIASAGFAAGPPQALSVGLEQGEVIRDADGRVRDAWALAIPASPERLLADGSALLFGGRPPALREVARVSSLTGEHIRYRQVVGGMEVLDAELTIDTDAAGTVTSIHDRTVPRPVLPEPAALTAAAAERAAAAQVRGGAVESRLVLLRDGDRIRSAYRVITSVPSGERFAVFLDASDGRALKTVALSLNAAARIFKLNPVETLNDPSLQDNDNSAAAVPDAAYSIVDLPDVATGGTLAGPNAEIVDVDSPHYPLADPAALAAINRSDSAFEEAMAYYHVDRSQRYLQSLGYTGARRIVTAPIEIDAHAGGGADNSFFVPLSPGQGRLQFGDGGVDDAEDPDIILHEYGHAIQESIAPSTFTGAYASQARALGEGFGDYWAFSAEYAANLAGGRDPFCIGDWDARCGSGPSSNCGYPPGADCLRRVDSPKTMSDYLNVEQRGVEHRNGEIWSSALRQIFLSLVARYGLDQGKSAADRIVLESHYGAPPQPQFATIARSMIEADRLLDGGANADVICAAFSARGILSSTDCSAHPRGELEVFQSPARDIPIPDADPSGAASSRTVTDNRIIEKLMVRVEIAHPFRGDLRIILEAPDGRTVLLQRAAGAAGEDIRATYGFDAEPAEPLDLFNGMPAAGRWTLHVIDVNPPDTGRIVSWDLIMRLAGDAPLAERPAQTGAVAVIPAAARLEGAAGTDFVTDVRVLNRGTREVLTTAWFTPTGADGRTDFAAVSYSVQPGQTLSLDDIVGSELRAAGSGTLQFTNADSLLVTSRTYSRSEEGTYGQFIPSAREENLTAAGAEPLVLSQLRNTPAFRSNIGFAEVAGGIGTVIVTIRNSSGAEISRTETTILPYSHIQFPLLGGIGGRTAEAVSAVVAVEGGNARVTAYGSVIDNASGDPVYVPGVKSSVAGAGVTRVPVAFRAPGAFGTLWRSDLWLTSEVAGEATVTFISSAGQRIAERRIELAPGEARASEDVVQSLFGLGSATGSIEVTAGGGVVATTRSWTDAPSGSFGQFIPARPARDALGAGEGEMEALHVEISNAFRTNAGLAEVSGAAAVVRFRLLDAAGGELWRREVVVPADGQVQLGLEADGAPAVTGGRLTFEVVSGGGKVLPYVSVIDNRSGDPIFVEAR